MGTLWHVLGAGSLGTLWACRLARAGVPVRLVLRDAQRLARYEQGPGLQLVEGSGLEAFKVPAQTPETPGPVSHLLVACKAYDAEPAVASLRHRLASGAQVVLLQNGLGSQQAVAAALPQAQVYFASTTEGAFQRPDGAVVFAGQGFTWIGRPGQATMPGWLTDLMHAGIPHQWACDIMVRLWRKLAVNCAINPLTVLLQCRNGDLQAHGAHVAILCKELSTVLTAVGQPAASEGLLADVQAIIAATAANYSSMYQDVAARRRTEVHYLLGYACAQARLQGVSTPALDALHQALLATLRDKGLPTN